MKSRVGTDCHVSSTEVVINRTNQANDVQLRTIRCLFGRYLIYTIYIIELSFNTSPDSVSVIYQAGFSNQLLD